MGKRVEMIQKEIMMAGSSSTERFAGLVDVIDETEELCYIDDDTIMTCPPDSMPKGDKAKDKSTVKETPEQGQGSGLKADDPIELETINAEQASLKLPLSPQTSLGDAAKCGNGDNAKDAAMCSQEEDALSLENTGMYP
jgi:hypothetical protein